MSKMKTSNPELVTERINPHTRNIDELSAREIVELINTEDFLVAQAVKQELDNISLAVEMIAIGFTQGGRLIYVGAGTSGRLGVLDASEMQPTFNIKPDMVKAIIAGGENAIIHPVEGSEDRSYLGKLDIQTASINENDVVVGISASGRTPYVLGAIEEANHLGRYTIGISCVKHSPLGGLANLDISPEVGPEVIAGSTRMKAGTAQKMVLNMLSTGSMILLGKTYKNLMVEVQPSNLKLRNRMISVVSEASNINVERAEELLRSCNWDAKVAIVVALKNFTVEKARNRLQDCGGRIIKVLNTE